MSHRWIAFAVAAVFVMLTNTTWQRRRLVRELHDELHAVDRFVDIGVRLHTVVADANGAELILGKPPLRVVRTQRFGGLLDTQLGRLVAPSRDPVSWFVSQDQEPVVLHRDSDPLGQLVHGSMGAGKTTAGVQWLYFRWLEMLGERREIGVTAPTEDRLDLVLAEMRQLWRPTWFRYRTADGIAELADGRSPAERTRIRFVSTYRQSAAQGSRIQGFNWSAHLGDEYQDQVEEHPHITARCRSAKHGRAKRLATATAKDSPEWRDLRDVLDRAVGKDGAQLWIRRTLDGRNSPFIDPSHWEAMRATMSKRQYDQFVGAKDLPPERATYPAWSRQHNLITIPEIGWTDVTEQVLRGIGPNYRVIVGHDPGSLFDVSIILKAYRTRDDQLRPTWVVVDELTTEQDTTEAHIEQLLALCRSRWGLNMLDRMGRVSPDCAQMLVHADPAGNTDTRPDRSVYTQFTRAGIKIRPAAFKQGTTDHGRVPKDAGIEVINTLLCNAAGERRLFVARKPDGSPCAPRLVHALETSERDLAGKAEAQRKNKQDVSHWPAALRYALWPLERARLAAIGARTAGGTV